MFDRIMNTLINTKFFFITFQQNCVIVTFTYMYLKKSDVMNQTKELFWKQPLEVFCK